MRIVAVCRSGGEYDWSHVERLRQQCAEHAPGVEFVCLSDDPRGEPLRHDWPGWFAKCEMWRLEGPCLYLDLDSTIVGDLTPLLDVARKHDFIVFRDVYRGRKDPHAVQSSVMAWRGDMRWLYEAFRVDAEQFISQYRTPERWGDQAWIQAHTAPESRVYWQDVLPGALVSWKAHCRSGVLSDARVVVFHGKPRPWQVGL